MARASCSRLPGLGSQVALGTRPAPRCSVGRPSTPAAPRSASLPSCCHLHRKEASLPASATGTQARREEAGRPESGRSHRPWEGAPALAPVPTSRPPCPVPLQPAQPCHDSTSAGWPCRLCPGKATSAISSSVLRTLCQWWKSRKARGMRRRARGQKDQKAAPTSR